MADHVCPSQTVPGQDQQYLERTHEEQALEARSPYPHVALTPDLHAQFLSHQTYDQLAYPDQHLQAAHTSTEAAHSDVPLSPAGVFPQRSYAASPDGRPGMVFNGYVLVPSAKPVPEEFIRLRSGTSIAEPGAILDEESGRTYYNHSTGRYYFPNDPAEQDRLDLQHKLCTLYHWGKLYEAPVVSPKRVLDIATGTGIWSCQFARQHPEAQVFGTDLSLIQPANAPQNCTFIKEDAEHDEWVFPEPFDFIFMRLVVSCFDNHKAVFQKAYDNLKPGGWFEIHDATFEVLCTDGSCDGSNVVKFFDLFIEAGAKVGRDFKCPRKYKQWITEIGFVDVVEHIGPLPGNPWPSDARNQDLGRWQMTNAYRGVRGIAWKLFREGLGMPPAEIEDLIEKVKFDLTDISLHFCFPVFTVYGRKPSPGETASQGRAQ